jgi:hypothetical protein
MVTAVFAATEIKTSAAPSQECNPQEQIHWRVIESLGGRARCFTATPRNSVTRGGKQHTQSITHTVSEISRYSIKSATALNTAHTQTA